MTINNPNLDIVNITVYTKFCQILSICSQDIELKQILTSNKLEIYGILSTLMCIQNLVKFCQFLLKILSGNEIVDGITE